jgi:Ca-activated chloride channel family protein
MFCTGIVQSEEVSDQLRRGVELFREGQFQEALSAFLNAEKAQPGDPIAPYNALTTMANSGRLEDMEKKLSDQFAALGADPTLRARSSYNLGTALLKRADEADKQNMLPQRAGELQKAIQWFKQSLLDDSADFDAKNNLEYAQKLLEKLQQQQQQQEQNQDQQQKKDDRQQDSQQKQQQDQEQQQKDQQQQDQQQQNQQQQQDQQQQNQQQQQQQQDLKEKEISDATAKNLLEAAKDAEKRAMRMLRENIKRKQKDKKARGKDW